MYDLQTFMPVQQLSWVVHSIQGQADTAAPQQTIKINREKFALHQPEGVQTHLPDQCKTCMTGN